MHRQLTARLTNLGALAALVVGLASCTDEKVVTKFVDKPTIPPVPAAAAGFMGYADKATKTTGCGTCHVEHQAQWASTAHASAFEHLQMSGASQAFCEGCHTTGQAGNATASDQVGWTAAKNTRYHDVQCESCHGPGDLHRQNPEIQANWPLASTNIDATLASTDGCAACHNDTHHPYAEEWAQSPHGAMPFTMEDPSHIVAAGTTAGCGISCHSGDGALGRMGVTTNHKEKGKVVTDQNFMKITCSVCHDPHANGNPGQLRFSVSSDDPSQNLCTKCHNRNAVPSLTSWRGPHSAVGMLVLGGNNVGWRPPGMTTVPIFGTHGDPAGNPGLCATCHLNKVTVNDANGQFAWQATGHLFNATPCLDATGKPVAGPCDETQKSFASCATGGCHGSANAARGVLLAAEVRLNSKLTELKNLLENTTRVPCSEFNPVGPTLKTARGARFNYLLAVGHAEFVPDAVCPGPNATTHYRALPAPHVDEGTAAHNPFLLEALLQSSIDAVKAQYYPLTPLAAK